MKNIRRVRIMDGYFKGVLAARHNIEQPIYPIRKMVIGPYGLRYHYTDDKLVYISTETGAIADISPCKTKKDAT
jgi:hypothetical protein